MVNNYCKLVAVLLLLYPGMCSAQHSVAHVEAHAHNDYLHPHPLLDALQSGFNSVEADVFVLNNQLVVAHENPGAKTPTLESLYLKPLDSIMHQQHSIYPNASAPFFLMIDFKTSAADTYPALHKLLDKYPDLRCLRPDCPVKIFISGNRPLELATLPYSGISIDGRPEDLGKGIPSENMPVISDHYRKWSTWNGIDSPTKAQLTEIQSLANRVHAEGKRLRLWAIPDQAHAWTVLLQCGVDMINTDNLKGLDEFLHTQKH